MSWHWNYFTLENMCKAKCSLCDHDERPRIRRQELLFDHIRDGTDIHHKDAYRKIKKFRKKFSKIDWNEHYKTVQSTGNMLNPIIECRHCGYQMFIQDGTEIKKKSFLNSTPKMKSHLKKKHEVDEGSWMLFQNGIELYTQDYCNVTKSGVIAVYTCRKCNNDDNESRAKNGIIFVKHLLEEHRCDGELEEFPWTNIPNEFRSLYSVTEDTTLSSDIADRLDLDLDLDFSHQGSSGVSSESTQSSRKRKEKVLKKISELEISTQIEEPLYKRIYSSTDDSN